MNRLGMACLVVLLGLSGGDMLQAEVGDPQVRTDHPWYPGELALSTFPRLFATQAEAWHRITGHPPRNDEEKALAAWFWRNTHYWHGQTGGRDLWGKGLNQGGDRRLREYWSGLFGYGFGLCGTTHSQWTAEMQHLLGHSRSRGVGVAGHNAFEVFLEGEAYGPKGRWALLDHDLSTVIFNDSGQRLLSIREVNADVKRWIQRSYKPERQQGWLVCGLHPDDGQAYKRYAVSEYLAGYAGPPPMVHLRRGESLRRYFQPGLEDGKTFVFWGRNARSGDIPGPERSRTWVNQPEAMHGSQSGTAHQTGQARFANAEYTYRPEFKSGHYREGLIEESDRHIVLGFQTPYIIAATPADLDAEWGIYQKGCRNGLVLRGHLGGAGNVPVDVSVDAGRTWQGKQAFRDGLDLTDHVKGRAHYWLRIGAGAPKLDEAQLEIRTVCQANVAILPRLKDGGTTIHYQASDQALFSMGPEAGLAGRYISQGGFGKPNVTLEARTRRPVTTLYAAAHVASGNPPNPNITYHIEYRTGQDASWKPLVQDWRIQPRGDEPGDFWSQSFCYGTRDVAIPEGQRLQVRFRNDGGKRFMRAEVHWVHETSKADPLVITYDWQDHRGSHRASRTFDEAGSWQLDTGRNVQTRWVEFKVKD